MHSSSIVALAFIAAASAAPIPGNVEARAGLASLGKVGGNLLNLGSLGFSLGNIVDSIFGRSTDEIEDILARHMMAREIPEVEARAAAGGLSKILGNVASGAGLLSSGINIGNFVDGLFSRELTDVEARAGLASLGKIGNNLLNLGSLGFSLGNIGGAIGDLLGGGDDAAPAARSIAEIEDHVTRHLMAREMSEVDARAAAGGLSKILGNVASGAGLLSSGINIGNFVDGLFGRELTDVEARAGLASLGKIGNNLLNLGSLGFSLGNIGGAIGDLFGGGDDAAPAARSIAEIEDHVTRHLMAREMSEVDARAAAGGLSKILGNVASGAGLLSSGINIGNFVDGLFGRELTDVEARAGLASLGKVGSNLLNLGSLGFSLSNIADSIFGRELEQHLARELMEESLYRRAVADLD